MTLTLLHEHTKFAVSMSIEILASKFLVVMGTYRGATLHQKLVVTGVGDIWRARGVRAYNVGLGGAPSGSPGAEPLVRGQGSEAPWSWKVMAKQCQNMYINFPQKETVCEKFQIARDKVVVTVTTTFKSSGDMLTCHHRHIQSCTYGDLMVLSCIFMFFWFAAHVFLNSATRWYYLVILLSSTLTSRRCLYFTR